MDIGNNGSAFVEVLVGRSTAPDVFEVLLPMCTFMTVSESKQWKNSNRVRMFGKVWSQQWASWPEHIIVIVVWCMAASQSTRAEGKGSFNLWLPCYKKFYIKLTP